MADSADVIVIGAGVQGSSLAFHLASCGASVIVVERSVVAAGATGRSSGLVRVYYDLLAEARIAWQSQAWFREWGDRVGGDCGFTKTGFLWIEPAERLERVRANSASHRAMGADSTGWMRPGCGGWPPASRWATTRWPPGSPSPGTRTRR